MKERITPKIFAVASALVILVGIILLSGIDTESNDSWISIGDYTQRIVFANFFRSIIALGAVALIFSAANLFIPNIIKDHCSWKTTLCAILLSAFFTLLNYATATVLSANFSSFGTSPFDRYVGSVSFFIRGISKYLTTL